jgi:patatin-like phospholipase/acyl hydrolase
VWEAASATAAAPMFFKPVILQRTKAEFGDGGMRRNNPINEAINEMNRLKEKSWAGRELGCLVSIGTGEVDSKKISGSVSDVLKAAISIMTDSEDTSDQFITSEFGQNLYKTYRYFRFNVSQGMQLLQLDDWKETEAMNAATTEYLRKHKNGMSVRSCALVLLDSDKNCESVGDSTSL